MREAIYKSDFIKIFSDTNEQKGFANVEDLIDIEDIFKPLNTYLKRKGKKIYEVFKKYDKDHNEMLSAVELKIALKDYLQFEITEEEVKVIKTYFRSKYKKVEIKKVEMGDLLNDISKLKRVANKTYSRAEAREALEALRSRLYND